MILAQFVQNVVSKATQTRGVLFFFPGAFLVLGGAPLGSGQQSEPDHNSGAV